MKKKSKMKQPHEISGEKIKNSREKMSHTGDALDKWNNTECCVCKFACWNFSIMFIPEIVWSARTGKKRRTTKTNNDPNWTKPFFSHYLLFCPFHSFNRSRNGVVLPLEMTTSTSSSSLSPTSLSKHFCFTLRIRTDFNNVMRNHTHKISRVGKRRRAI